MGGQWGQCTQGARAATFSFLPNLFLVENGRQDGASPTQKKESRRPWIAIPYGALVIAGI